jgi:casein kinase 1
MNYVRKLGFEETPDYDFLRELFTKVLRTTGEVDDNVFDWNLLNNGKGWEAGNVSFMFIPRFHSCSYPSISLMPATGSIATVNTDVNMDAGLANRPVQTAPHQMVLLSAQLRLT